VTRVESRFSRFSLVGMIGALLQLLLISLLTKYFRIGSIAATLIAVEITILHNFIWHQRFTWSDRDLKSSRQIARLWRFHVGNGLISLAGNTLVVYCLVERLNAPIVPTAIGAIILCSLANFLLADRWVYTDLRIATRLSVVWTPLKQTHAWHSKSSQSVSHHSDNDR
jgi:putative flippase GtrA